MTACSVDGCWPFCEGGVVGTFPQCVLEVRSEGVADVDRQHLQRPLRRRAGVVSGANWAEVIEGRAPLLRCFGYQCHWGCNGPAACGIEQDLRACVVRVVCFQWKRPRERCLSRIKQKGVSVRSQSTKVVDREGDQCYGLAFQFLQDLEGWFINLTVAVPFFSLS